MNNFIDLVIFLAIPIIVWMVLGLIIGIGEYGPSSFWVYACEFTSVYLFPLGLILYNKIKKRNQVLATISMVVSFILIIPSVIYIRNDISSVKAKQQTFTLWENSLLTTCQSFGGGFLPSNAEIKIKEQIWMVTNGRFGENDKDQLLFKEPEEWNSIVQAIAMIDESYRETG
jgi:uncharacterized membrane protein